MSGHFKFLALFFAVFGLLSVSSSIAMADDTGVPHTHDEGDSIAIQREMRKARQRIERTEARKAAREARQKRISDSVSVGSSRNTSTQRKRYIYNKSQNRKPSNIGGRTWSQ